MTHRKMKVYIHMLLQEICNCKPVLGLSIRPLEAARPSGIYGQKVFKNEKEEDNNKLQKLL